MTATHTQNSNKSVDGTVCEHLGESFSAGDVLLELETDKAQIDVEAPEDGVLAKIMVCELPESCGR